MPSLFSACGIFIIFQEEIFTLNSGASFATFYYRFAALFLLLDVGPSCFTLQLITAYDEEYRY